MRFPKSMRCLICDQRCSRFFGFAKLCHQCYANEYINTGRSRSRSGTSNTWSEPATCNACHKKPEKGRTMCTGCILSAQKDSGRVCSRWNCRDWAETGRSLCTSCIMLFDKGYRLCEHDSGNAYNCRMLVKITENRCSNHKKHVPDTEVNDKLQVFTVELDLHAIVVSDYNGDTEKLAKLLETEIRLFRYCHHASVKVEVKGKDTVFQIDCDYSPNISAFEVLQLIAYCSHERPYYSEITFKENTLYFP